MSKKFNSKLRSQQWFDNPENPGMTALYIERSLNFEHEFSSSNFVLICDSLRSICSFVLFSLGLKRSCKILTRVFSGSNSVTFF